MVLAKILGDYFIRLGVGAYETQEVNKLHKSGKS